MNIEWTNSESAQTKAAIARLHYIDDQFVQLLCPTTLKRTPEINRGYYGRFQAVNHLIKQFLKQSAVDGHQTAQIVNIGSGFDSLYFRLKADSSGFSKVSYSRLKTFARVVDVDSSHVIANKVQSIRKSEQLRQQLEPVEGSASVESSVTSLHSRRYHLVSCDATKPKKLFDLLVGSCDVIVGEPVLFVFECVLLYWTSEQTNALISSFSRLFTSAAFLVFDLVNTDDHFARLMQQSLSERETPLLGVAGATSLADWRTRFTCNGCAQVIAWNMNDVFETLLPEDDRRRVERIEFLDEKELLSQLLRHYCLVFASNYCSVFW